MIGTIILANYNDILSHVDKQGFFLVIYDEACDKSNNNKYNITALKITSNLEYENAYSIPINHYKFTKKSIVQCSKMYTFDKHDVIESVGYVNDNYMKRVVSMLEKFLREINTQRERRRLYGIQKRFDVKETSKNR